MRKKIIFGAILSASILISLQFIAPVNVKASELQTAEDIKERIEELGKLLDNDQNIVQLIDMHKNQEVENIFTQVLEAETNGEIQILANQYVDLLGKEQLNQIFENLADGENKSKSANRQFPLKINVLSFNSTSSSFFISNFPSTCSTL